MDKAVVQATATEEHYLVVQTGMHPAEDKGADQVVDTEEVQLGLGGYLVAVLIGMDKGEDRQEVEVLIGMDKTVDQEVMEVLTGMGRALDMEEHRMDPADHQEVGLIGTDRPLGRAKEKAEDQLAEILIGIIFHHLEKIGHS